MLAYAKSKDLKSVLKLHAETITNEDFGPPSMQRMTSVMIAYAKSGQPENAEKLLLEMRDEMGMQPDVVCYTTVIDGYRKNNNLDKCWELYEECSECRNPGQDIDEVLMSYMIRVCAATHDGEKAIRMFNDLELDGFVEHAKPYNSIMMACASTKRFSHKAIEFWHAMHAKNLQGD
jgi:pentatricopeptide repeat protein